METKSPRSWTSALQRYLLIKQQTCCRPLSFLGKPQYSSPEQCGFLTQGTIDQRTDIYSLAVTLHFLLTGSLPFSCPSPQVIW